jgi:hypothetical protein
MERYSDFKANTDFHAVRRPLENDERYVYSRKCNPLNPNSSTQKFYSPDILREFDKTYTRNSKESISKPDPARSSRSALGYVFDNGVQLASMSTN